MILLPRRQYKYLYYRDSFQLNDAMSYDDDVPSEAESAPEE